MFKKIVLFIALLSLFSCGFSDLRERGELPGLPQFEDPETLLMRENPVQFMARRLNVWTMDYFAFGGDLESRKEASLYKIVEKLVVDGKEYALFDNRNGGKEYRLKEQLNENSRDTIRRYTISSDGTVLAKIEQVYRDDYFYFSLQMGEKSYYIEPLNNFQRPFVREIIFTLRDEERVYSYFNKKVSYVKNEYDIVIDRTVKAADDVLIVGIALFVDHILFEKGYDYKR